MTKLVLFSATRTLFHKRNVSMTSSLTRRRMLQTGVAAAALTGMPQLGWAAGPVVKLRIMETTELHVNILTYDY